jgi:uncharacterized membrane protein
MTSSKDEDKTALRVERLMQDTKWDWARTNTSLRVISFAAIAFAVSTPIAFWFENIAGVACGLILILLFTLLRVALREVADLPDRYLDERQRTVRNAIYLKAYQYLAGFFLLITVAIFAAGIAADFSDEKLTVQLSFEQLSALAWLFVGPIMIAPNVALALSKGTK